MTTYDSTIGTPPTLTDRVRNGPSERRPSDRPADQNPISERTVHAAHTVILVIAPTVMAAGLLYHPSIGNPTDPDFLATISDAVNADPFRWAAAHHLIGLGAGLVALAYMALHVRLKHFNGSRYVTIGFPLVVIGSFLYALLPAMEFAPLAAAELGTDAGDAQAVILPWFVPTLFSGALIFFVGTIYVARGLVLGGAVDRRVALFAASALVLAAASRLFPVNSIQLDLQAIFGILAMWPLAYVTWTNKWEGTQ